MVCNCNLILTPMIPPHQILQLVCFMTNSTPRSLMQSNKKYSTVIPRQLAFYLLFYHGALMTHRIAELFQTQEANIRHQLKTVQKAQYNKFPTAYQVQLRELINEANGYFSDNVYQFENY